MCASAVLPLTQGQPVLRSAKKLRKCRKRHHPLWLWHTRELPTCQGALSYTHMTDTSVDKKLHMAFTPLVTAPAPWKGPAVLRVLAEVCRALCCLGGCTLVSIDPRDSPPPSMP